MILRITLIAAYCLTMTARVSLADETYAGDGVQLLIDERDQAGFAGWLTINGKKYEVTATEKNGRFEGSLYVGQKEYPFTMTKPDATGGVVLESAGKRYALSAGDDARPAPGQGPGNVANPNPPPFAPRDNPAPRISAPGIAMPGKTIVLTRKALIDQASGVEAAILLVPDGWEVRSKMLWKPLSAQWINNTSEIVDPKTGAAVRWLPWEQMIGDAVLYQNAMQTGQRPVTGGGALLTPRVLSVAEYLQSVVLPQFRNMPGVRIVGVQDLPQVAAVFDQNDSVVAMMKQNRYDVQIQAARVRIEYPAQNGSPVEEDIFCTYMISCSQVDAQMRRQVGTEPAINFWPVELVAYSAPKGQLDAMLPLLQAITGSARSTVRWSALITRIAASIRQIEANEATLAAAAREQITASQQQRFNQQWESEERIARGRGDVLRGSQRFDEPGQQNTQIQMPAGYGHAWSDGNGKYILTDDPNFKPSNNPDIQGNWNPMNPSR